MSPFQKNLQRLLVLAFTAVSVSLVVIGINRSKNSALSTVPAPEQGTLSTSSSKLPVSSIETIKYTGKTYQTPWGNVVAGISVTSGKITDVTMPQVPNSPPSQYAKSFLIGQALATGSANIQGVSGATYTSIAFKSSLESAIAEASANGQIVVPKTAVNSAVLNVPASAPSVPRSYRGNDEWND